MPKRGIDSECYRLAEHFLPQDGENCTPQEIQRRVDALAEQIQIAVEDFFLSEEELDD